MAALRGRDVGQLNQVCGNARHGADVTAKPQRRLQLLPGGSAAVAASLG